MRIFWCTFLIKVLLWLFFDLIDLLLLLVIEVFGDDSSISTSRFLTRLLRAFFLKRPPEKYLLPAWSLPVVLRSLMGAPFGPMSNIPSEIFR